MNIVVLTGAGVSTESGLSTFRDANGLWEGFRIEDVCTSEALQRSPDLVCAFYDDLRVAARKADPNGGHLALVELENYWFENRKGEFLVVTQNVDDLHERAGSQNLIHMHGELNSAYCMDCGVQFVRYGPLEDNRECPSCSHEALRPDIVLFGETPRCLPTIEAALEACHIFVAIGTSGNVLPAADFAAQAKSHGAETLLLNLEIPELPVHFSDCRMGPASRIVPQWVSELRLKMHDTMQRSGE